MLVDDCGENIIRCDYIVDGVIRRRDIEVGVSLLRFNYWSIYVFVGSVLLT